MNPLDYEGVWGYNKNMDVKEIQAGSPAAQTLTTSDKRALINKITSELGMGGWSCPESGGGWDVTDEDIEREWSELASTESGQITTVYGIALVIAANWERECILAD